MSLKLVLKPKERLIIGGAVLVNGSSKTELLVENSVPILRGKDIMTLAGADTPCKKIYFAIQLMYIDEKAMADHHKTYWELVKDVSEAAPGTRPMLKDISEEILRGRHYDALKLTKKLVEYEEEAIKSVRTNAGI